MTFAEKEERFFALVQEDASARGAKFFMDTSEGRDLETDTLYCEDFSGWLVPFDQANAFFADWQQDEEAAIAKWDSFFVFAEWRQQEDKILIDFIAR